MFATSRGQRWRRRRTARVAAAIAIMAPAMSAASPRVRFSPCGAIGVGEVAGALGLGAIGAALTNADGVGLGDSAAKGELIGARVGDGATVDGDDHGDGVGEGTTALGLGEGTTALGLGETQFGSMVKRTVRCST